MSGTAGQEPAAVLARQGAAAVITLNRPHVMSVVDARMSGAVGQALSDPAGDPALRVGVITGVGPAFCAGQMACDEDSYRILSQLSPASSA